MAFLRVESFVISCWKGHNEIEDHKYSKMRLNLTSGTKDDFFFFFFFDKSEDITLFTESSLQS